MKNEANSKPKNSLKKIHLIITNQPWKRYTKLEDWQIPTLRSKNKPIYAQLTFPGLFFHLIFGFIILRSKLRALDILGNNTPPLNYNLNCKSTSDNDEGEISRKFNEERRFQYTLDEADINMPKNKTGLLPQPVYKN